MNGVLLVIAMLFASPETSEPPMHLILLAGQSNMAGRGEIAPEDLEPHPRVVMLNADGDWVPAVAPVHYDLPDLIGVGLGRTFAVRYAEDHPGVTVGLIPAAEGGSSIEAWRLGGTHGKRRARPYDSAIARTQRALRDGKLVAILWHQGESDCNAEDSPLHESRLRTLIASLRADLDAGKVPFLIGQLGQFRDPPWGENGQRVDDAHRVVANDDPLAAFVSSEGLDDGGDELHFSADAYREFGDRYYEAFLELDRTGE
ncbi:MAG: sialate O-acetylesterase [Planctomycetota bacterium]